MPKPQIVDIIIPVLNEQNAVGLVIDEIPKDRVRHIIVVDNGSTDDTMEVAKMRGAVVLEEAARGYGNACLKGMSYIANNTESKPDAVVFLDGDHSDYPEHIHALLEPIRVGHADLVIGSRSLGRREVGAMTPQQVFGNWLATYLLRLLFKVRYTDLGPFRAVKYDCLLEMQMNDKTYGWTVEMQLKAAKLKMKIAEVPVNYRNRIGVSKISGTVRGTIMAGYKIIQTIFRYL